MTGSTEISVLAAEGSEGGGAAIGQVIGMTAVAMVIGALLCWLGYLHRTRKITWVNSVAEYAGRKFKRPPWVAVPLALFIGTLICALFGFIWDVSLHIGKGRDPGPLANPAHYFILVGLFLLFVAGCAAIVLPYEKPGPFAVRITKDWYAPVSGFLMAGCGLYALTGFPLDDVWHRIFGQDVTLWGPTHLMMIGGAGFATMTALLLEYEGDRAMGDDKPKDGIFLKGRQVSGLRRHHHRPFGVPDRVRLRRAPVPPGVRADADRVGGRVRTRRRANDVGTRRRDHCRTVRDRTARHRRADSRSRVRCADQLVRAVSRRSRRDRTGRAHRDVQAADPVRPRQRFARQHRRAVAGIVVDRRRLPLPVADQHLAGGADDGRAGNRPHRCVRSDARHGAHRSTTAVAAPSASGWWR